MSDTDLHRRRPVWCGPPMDAEAPTHAPWQLTCPAKPSPEQIMDMIIEHGLDALWMLLSWPMIKKTLILHDYDMDMDRPMSTEHLPWLTHLRHSNDPEVQLLIHFYEKDEKLKTSDLVRIIDHAIDLEATDLWIIGRLNWVESCRTTLKTVLEHYFDKTAPRIRLWNAERFAFDETDHQIMPMVAKVQREDLQHLAEDVDKLPSINVHDPMAIRLNLKPDDLVLTQRSFPTKHFNARIVK